MKIAEYCRRALARSLCAVELDLSEQQVPLSCKSNSKDERGAMKGEVVHPLRDLERPRHIAHDLGEMFQGRVREGRLKTVSGASEVAGERTRTLEKDGAVGRRNAKLSQRFRDKWEGELEGRTFRSSSCRSRDLVR